MQALKKPDLIIKEAAYCGGCGYGVIQRLVAESLEEMNLAHKAISVVDISCCFWIIDCLDTDGIAGPHGRCAAVATAVKKVRPDSFVFVCAGDGASYSIGLAETMYAAMRDVPITMIVVNNGIFGMTGGQMSPGTTLLGDSTSTTPYGRDRAMNGAPVDMLQILSGIDIEFIARGALYSSSAIQKTKAYIKKGFKNQVENRGLSVIEILSPCPTNWGVSPIEANVKVKNEMEKALFPLKVYLDRGGKI
jgi:2-oxoglutarate ferredoxin oxidoreductase subunit beta